MQRSRRPGRIPMESHHRRPADANRYPTRERKLMLSAIPCGRAPGILDRPVQPIYPLRFACIVLLAGVACWPLFNAYPFLSVCALTALNFVAVPLLFIYKRRLQTSLAVLAFVAGLSTLLLHDWDTPLPNGHSPVQWAVLASACLSTVVWLTYPVWRIARKT